MDLGHAIEKNRQCADEFMGAHASMRNRSPLRKQSLRKVEQPQQFQSLVAKIQKANTLLLSTHRQADGDGVGAQIALYHALKKAGKNVRILNIDPVPKKYHFLQTQHLVDVFERAHAPMEPTDLVLIFDTNDPRLIEPLWPVMEEQAVEIAFIDHHPILSAGPQPTEHSYIDTTAASTGEITYQIIKSLGIELDAPIARGLYTSIVFDTQLFRYIRASSQSHQICAELLDYEKHPEEIHRHLFATRTIQKVAFLAKALDRIEYFYQGQLAFLKLQDKDLLEHGLDWDESRDVIDMIMNIESLEAAVLFREDGPDQYKMSLRSKGTLDVLSIAEEMGGGGHLFSAGGFLQGNFSSLKKQVLDRLTQQMMTKTYARGPKTQS
jgi:phosphoesterase RecJ-like protein